MLSCWNWISFHVLEQLQNYKIPPKYLSSVEMLLHAINTKLICAMCGLTLGNAEDCAGQYPPQEKTQHDMQVKMVQARGSRGSLKQKQWSIFQRWLNVPMVLSREKRGGQEKPEFCQRKWLEDEKGEAWGRAHCSGTAGAQSDNTWLQPNVLKILWHLSPFVWEWLHFQTLG